MKKKNLFLSFTFLFALLVVFTACNKEAEQDLPYKNNNLKLPTEVAEYRVTELPQSFQNQIGNTEILENISNEVATIGRVLFYDTKLSVNNLVSCGSCHKQEFAFSDPVAGSIGFDGAETPRNAQSIVNCFTKKSFFWDGRVRNLNEMVLKPIGNHIEMGLEELDELEVKLANTDYYPALFEAAYGSSEITKEKIADGLTQFLNALVSIDSKFDKAGGEFFFNQEGFTASELAGAELFWGRARCADCHSGVNMRGWNDEDVANIGLDVEYKDQGIENGHFLVPSLRNVALTAPYMHDGRFASLRDVVNHYNKGIQDHPQLDSRLRGEFGWDPTGDPTVLNLSDKQVDDLVAFLNTFTDEVLIADTKFSDPFVR